jgi:hypothetical protein
MEEHVTLWVRKLHFTGEFSTVLRGIRKPLQAMGGAQRGKGGKGNDGLFLYSI